MRLMVALITFTSLGVCGCSCCFAQILGGGILAGNLAKREGATVAASPRAIAYQAVHDATNDIELAANTVGEDSDAYGPLCQRASSTNDSSWLACVCFNLISLLPVGCPVQYETS